MRKYSFQSHHTKYECAHGVVHNHKEHNQSVIHNEHIHRFREIKCSRT